MKKLGIFLLVAFPFFAAAWLPWPFALAGAVFAAPLAPLAPLAAGIFTDTLYLASGAGIPLGLATGLALCLAGYGVRHFFATSIMA